MPDFPDGYPLEFEKTLRDAGATEQEIDVYRISKSGILNRDAFLSSFEEEQRGLILKQKRNRNSLGYYSTSCSTSLRDLEGLLSIFMRHYPQPVILKGVTASECGLTQVTITREREYTNKDHVDWWLFKDSDPCKYFKVLDNE